MDKFTCWEKRPIRCQNRRMSLVLPPPPPTYDVWGKRNSEGTITLQRTPTPFPKRSPTFVYPPPPPSVPSLPRFKSHSALQNDVNTDSFSWHCNMLKTTKITIGIFSLLMTMLIIGLAVSRDVTKYNSFGNHLSSPSSIFRYSRPIRSSKFVGSTEMNSKNLKVLQTRETKQEPSSVKNRVRKEIPVVVGTNEESYSRENSDEEKDFLRIKNAIASVHSTGKIKR